MEKTGESFLGFVFLVFFFTDCTMGFITTIKPPFGIYICTMKGMSMQLEHVFTKPARSLWFKSPGGSWVSHPGRLGRGKGKPRKTPYSDGHSCG